MTGNATASRQGRLVAYLRLGWLGLDRATGYSRILWVVLLLGLVYYFLEATGETGSDFLAFWSAGKLVAQSAAATVYDPAAVGAVQAAIGRHDVFAYVNPPPFLLIVTPFGLLPYPLAWIAWVALGWGVWFAVSRRLVPKLNWPVAAFPGAWLGATHAQSGLVCGALMGGFALLLSTSPFAAGLCVGALIIKPHLAVLFPIALIAGRQWRAFAGAAAGAVGLLLLAWAAFGTQAILNYSRSWEVSQVLIRDGSDEFFLRQVTVYSQMRMFGSPSAATVVQALASLAAAGVTWRAWRGPGSLDGKIALLMAATPLATPYLFSYDLPFLIVPVGWLVWHAGATGWGTWDRPILLLLYLSPLITRAAALPLGINAMPAVSCLMLWMIWRRLRRGSDQRA